MAITIEEKEYFFDRAKLYTIAGTKILRMNEISTKIKIC